VIVSTAALCLAVNIYHEARGEMVPGQYAVALVTMNRADGKPSQVCTEVFRYKQFSWANETVIRTPNGWRLSAQMQPRDAYAWWMAQRIADHTLAGKMPDFTQGARFYHARQVKPYWVVAMSKPKKVGNHLFYSRKVSQS